MSDLDKAFRRAVDLREAAEARGQKWLLRRESLLALGRETQPRWQRLVGLDLGDFEMGPVRENADLIAEFFNLYPQVRPGWLITRPGVTVVLPSGWKRVPNDAVRVEVIARPGWEDGRCGAVRRYARTQDGTLWRHVDALEEMYGRAPRNDARTRARLAEDLGVALAADMPLGSRG